MSFKKQRIITIKELEKLRISTNMEESNQEDNQKEEHPLRQKSHQLLIKENYKN